MKAFALSLLAAALLMTTATFSFASPPPTSVFTLTDNFDDTFDSTNTPPFVGTGTLQYTAASALGDGSYSWDSLTPTVNIVFNGGDTFTQADLATTSADVYVEIRGSSFFFTNVDERGDGPGGGSASFVNGDGNLFNPEPGTPGGTDFIISGDSNSPVYFLDGISSSPYDVVYSGNYGVSAVPEPSDWAWVAVLGTLGIVGVRRLRGSMTSARV